MITPAELLRVLLAPLLVAALIAGVGRWRRWAWAMPLAVGTGFFAGYALLGVPRLPPRDGTDWLFWLAIPATVLGVIDAIAGKRWGWVFGAIGGAIGAGMTALVIVRPLTPHAVSAASLCTTTALFALAGAAVCLAAGFAESRVGPRAIVAALCVTLGGAAVVVLSSNLRIVGVYGIAAAAALGPVILLVGKIPAGRSVAVVAVSILTGLLAGGHFYPDPGVSMLNLIVLTLAPALILLGALIPDRRPTLRGVAAVAAVAIAVGAVTGPTALAAKRAAEAQTDGKDAEDPYSQYYK